MDVGDTRMPVVLENKAKSRKNRGISPVIASVILVAVAITVAVAVSYWMSGISSQYTKYESVGIISGVCTNIEIDTYNTTAVAGEWTTDMTSPMTITSGQTVSVNIYISSSRVGSTLSSGTSVNIKFHSAAGMDYVSLKELV